MKNISLTGGNGIGRSIIVDDEDYEYLNQFKWHYGNGYAVTSWGKRPNRKKMSVHQLLTDCPKGMMVDHRNRNKLDNTRQNLRVCTNSQNQMNAKKQINSSSEYKGVIKSKPWRATYGRKTIGYFDSEIEAAQAYDRYAKEMYGEYANLNFPVKLKAI